MKKQSVFRKVWSEIKTGKNLTLYMTLAGAIVIGVLKAVAPPLADAYLASVTLGTLSLIAIHQLGMTDMVQKGFDSLLARSAGTTFESFPEALFSSSCEKASREIRIYMTYIPGATPLPLGLIKAAKAGIPVRIILLNLISPIAVQRMKDIGLAIDNRPIENAFRTLRHVFRKNKLDSCISLRFCNSLPPCSMFAADDFAIFSLYWHGRENLEQGSPHKSIDLRECAFGEELVRQFESAWIKATPAEECGWWRALAQEQEGQRDVGLQSALPASQ